MKNCASDVHKEILSPEFMGVVKTVITSSRVRQGEDLSSSLASDTH